MRDAEEASLTKTGTVTIFTEGRLRVNVEGFEGRNCSCREVAALAMAWAIGELQRELVATLQKPGGGSCGLSSSIEDRKQFYRSRIASGSIKDGRSALP
jgi:hypothetical protein